MGIRLLVFGLLFLLNILQPAFADKAISAGVLINNGKSGDFAMLGVGVNYYTDESPAGFYANLLFPTGNEVLDGETQQEDVLRGAYSRNYLLNIGATKSVFSWFGVYAGLGIGYKKAYEGWDTSGRPATNWLSSALSSGGNGTDPDIYLAKPSEDKKGLNLNAGVQLMIKKFSMEAGYNTFTETAYIGFGMAFSGF